MLSSSGSHMDDMKGLIIDLLSSTSTIFAVENFVKMSQGIF